MADFDLIVLGAGNAGLAAAGVARAAGWRVAVVEARDVGGTCPLRGCVPKKVLVAAAEAMEAVARAGEQCIEVGTARLDWAKLVEREQGFVRGVSESFEAGLKAKGTDLIRGQARFVARDAIEAGGRRLSARKIVVATGSRPRALAMAGGQLAVTSDDLLVMRRLPESIVFVGAGVIAMELGHVMARAGARVTLVEMAERPLLGFDADCVAHIVNVSHDSGIEVVTGATIESIEARGEKRALRLMRRGEAREIVVDVAANGAGRIAGLESLDLDAGGVEHDRGVPKLDAYLRSTSNPDVAFCGDAHPGVPQLSPLATYEGTLVGRNLTTGALVAADHASIPSAVFTIPALARVGLDESQARARGIDVAVKTNDMSAWRSTRTYAERAAFAKVLVGTKDDRIVGAHLVGHRAEEIVHAFALAIRFGITATQLRETVFAYPTFHADVKFLV